MIELIAVPLDGMGRSGAQASAPAVLRDAGLMEALGSRVAGQTILDLPGPSSRRSGPSQLLNEVAVTAMVKQLTAQVTEALDLDRFPIVYGGDFSVLLAAVPALHTARGSAGLGFFDGPEGTTGA